MAFIRLKSERSIFVTAEQGKTIWQIMNGEIEGTPEQVKFIDTIDKLYLNPATAPKSYLDQQKREEEPQPRMWYQEK